MIQYVGLPRHRIPSRWEQITPDWVTAAIAVRHPKAKVKDVTILTRDDGTNKRVRLGLTYRRGRGPQTLFLRTHETSHRSVHLRNGNLFNEARLFATRVPLNIEHPFIFKAMVDWLDVNYLLVMEDLQQRGADPRDATRPMTVNQVASGLRGLAQLHSQFWGTQHRKLRWVKTWAPPKDGNTDSRLASRPGSTSPRTRYRSQQVNLAATRSLRSGLATWQLSFRVP